MQLRNYQIALKNNIYKAWNEDHKNVLAVLPTGAGKTVVFSSIIAEHKDGATCAIAHRQELVGQISSALAGQGVYHKIIGPVSVVRYVVSLHMELYGRSYYNPNSPHAVAGIDTLIRRGEQLKRWLPTVNLWVQDEGHHILEKNKWGTGAAMFPNARGLAVTATASRADGKGLGRHADGILDTIVEGPGMRALIDAGYLTDYRIFAPPSDLDLSSVSISQSTGDYSRPQAVKAVKQSRIVGDVVEHYQRIAPGKLGITFVTDVETASEVATQFNAVGVPAAVISHKTPDKQRAQLLRQFKTRQILQLVNVDLFGEGFDLPALEVVSFARPTESYGLYCQQFGRSLRPMEGKGHAIIIDHAGNVIRHGLPDTPREWTLDRRERRRRTGDGIPVRVCPNCTAVYERIHKVCPYCDYQPVPAVRSAPEHVDGDLTELDAATLARLRGEVERIDLDKEEYRAELSAKRAPPIGQLAHVKRHVSRQRAQDVLRNTIALWAGKQRAEGKFDSESYRRFYFTYGIDVLTAQTLGEKDALKLAARINDDAGTKEIKKKIDRLETEEYDPMIGETFGKLKVLKKAKNSGRHKQYLCLCARCKNKKVIKSTALKSGQSTSCGCKRSL